MNCLIKRYSYNLDTGEKTEVCSYYADMPPADSIIEMFAEKILKDFQEKQKEQICNSTFDKEKTN